MVLDRERRRRQSGLKKWMAMLVAAVRTLRHSDPSPARFLERQGTCLSIGNNEYGLALRLLGTARDWTRVCFGSASQNV